MTETLQSLWSTLAKLIATPLGSVFLVVGIYFLLQLVILPRLGVST